MVEGYTQQQLIDIYNSEGGKVYVDAIKKVETAVPSSINLNGITMSHMAVYFQPENMLFAYYSIHTTVNHGFTYLTSEQANLAGKKS